MEPDQRELSTNPPTINNAHKKRPVTAAYTRTNSASNETKVTKDDISMQRNGSDGIKNPPKSGTTHRTREIGKVKPIRILPTAGQKNSKEMSDFIAELNKNEENVSKNEDRMDDSDEDDLSLIEEKSKLDSDSRAVITVDVIDPTKDFYSTSGRPVSPVVVPVKVEVHEKPSSDFKSDDDEWNDKLIKSENLCENDSSDIKQRSTPVPPKPQRKLSVGSSERVKVIVRSRPLSQKELGDGHECVVQVHYERNEIEVRRPKTLTTSSSSFGVGDTQDQKVFAFDSVYDSRTTQMDLYENAFKPLVDSALEGFNGTIFAYGQTGTGKTYTMEGVREKESEQGVIPNAFRHIFSQVAENSNKQYLIRASYLEIYQEEIRDLLSKDRKQHRELRESPTSGVYVKDLSTYLCSNFSEINDLMTRGNKNRAVGATNMNEHSSRSHAIFMITIEMSEKWSDGRNHFKVGKLNLVDLAGSERQGKTGAAGERFKEATKINLSLSALGNVIAALVDGKSTHIPYRDSKLTRLLQDSLGGNSRTIMVATIGPASFNWDETITTLRYASRAKKIKNKPKVNEDPKDALLRQYQEEIERLRVELERKKAKQALMLQQSQADSSDSKTRQNNKSSRSHTASSTASDSSTSTVDLQRQVEEQRLRELAPLLEPYGLDPTTDPQVIMEKLAERRKELLQDNLTMKTEKDTLLKKLDETESLVRNTETECSKLGERIKWLESKVLTGGKDLVDHTNEQQKLIQAKQRELAEQIERYEEMKKKMQEEELTIEELRVNAEAFESELQAKTKKYKKLTQKLQTTKEDVERAHEDHSINMRELETVLMELKKEFSLKKMIIDNFIPPASRKMIEKRIVWGEDEQQYKLAPLDSSNAIQRPPLDTSMKLPLFNISETEVVHMVENVHFSDENILQLHPEMPKRRTKDYVPPSTDPYITSLVRRAIDDAEKDVIIDCNHISKKRTATAKIPHQSMDYFKMGDNLIRRVKSARPVSRPGEQQQLQFHDFAIVSPTSSITISNPAEECTPLELLMLSPFAVTSPLILTQRVRKNFYHQTPQRNAPQINSLYSPKNNNPTQTLPNTFAFSL